MANNIDSEGLLDIIDALVDGIDGYESEGLNTDRYWQPEPIERARMLLIKNKRR